MSGFPWAVGECDCLCGGCPDEPQASAYVVLSCTGPTYDVSLSVKGPSGTVIATGTQTSEGYRLYFDATEMGDYELTATPNGSLADWFGPLTVTRTKTECVTTSFPFTMGGFLPFLKGDTHVCSVWCGDSFMLKQLYLTDGVGTHPLTYTSGTSGNATWTASSSCTYGDGFGGTCTVTLSYDMKLYSDNGTNPVKAWLHVRIVSDCGPIYDAGDGVSSSFTCSPFAAAWSEVPPLWMSSSLECQHVLDNITVSE